MDLHGPAKCKTSTAEIKRADAVLERRERADAVLERRERADAVLERRERADAVLERREPVTRSKDQPAHKV
jgi:hypothetical protein